MTANLLACAVLDFNNQGWVRSCWKPVCDTLRPGKAGQVFEWHSANAGLAWRQDFYDPALAINVQAGKLSADSAGYCTVFIGRIFDRADLARSLDVSGDVTDSELYSAAFRAWGENCDERIVGKYAAIQWHEARNELRLARSPLQAPPLHIWMESRKLAVASLPKSIFAAAGPARLDPAHLANAAIRNFTNPSRSYYHGLTRVAPGTVVRVNRTGIARREFWSARETRKIRISDEKEVLGEATRLLHRSVEMSLHGSERPAIALSGGLDSQTVAAFALERLKQQQLRSYTSVPVTEWLPKTDPRLVYDETANVELLAARYSNLVPTFMTAEHRRFGADLDQLLDLGGWPTVNEMNMHWVHEIHHQAAEHGCDVLLNAEFGESSISYDGMTAFPGWLSRGKWLHLLKELRAFRDNRTFLRRAAALAMLPLLGSRWRGRLNRLRGRKDLAIERWSPANCDNHHVIDAVERAVLDGHDLSFAQHCDTQESRAAMMITQVSEGSELDLSLQLMHGIQRRDPTAYRPLWEFCASLPDELFFRDGIDRRLARRMLSQYAPQSIAWQNKTGIQSADFAGRLQRDSETMLRATQSLNPADSLHGIIDCDRINTILRACSDPNGDSERDWLKLASLVPRGVAMAWFVRHVEQCYGE